MMKDPDMTAGPQQAWETFQSVFCCFNNDPSDSNILSDGFLQHYSETSAIKE